MGQVPLGPAFACFEASQEDTVSSVEIAGRLEQARAAALLGIAESLAALAVAAVGEPGDPQPPRG